MRRLILPVLLFAFCSLALAQEVGDHSTAGFTFNRTYLHSQLGDVKPPLRLFETIPLTGTSAAESLVVFDGLMLVGESSSFGDRDFHLYSGSNRLWTVPGVSLGPMGPPVPGYVPAYANDLVILGFQTSTSIKAIEVSGGGTPKWQNNTVGETSGRYPILTDRLALFHGRNRLVAANALTGATIWQYPNTAQGAAVLAQAPLSLFGNRVYLLDEQTRLHALDLRTGERMWMTPQAGGNGSNIIATEKWVYINDPATGNFGALDAATGTVVNWVHTYPAGRAFAPNRGIALAYGNLYAFAGNKVAAYSAETGEQVWEYTDPTPGTVTTSVVDHPVIANNVVYYYNRNTGRLRSLDAFTGTLLWSIHEPGVRAVAAADQSLYLLFNNNVRVYAPMHETYMAEVGSGGGITTLLTLNNMSAAPANATLFFLGENGAPLSLPVAGLTGNRSEVPLVLAPFSAATVQVQESAQFIGGWAGVISDQLLRGTAIFQSRMGGQVFSEVGVGDSPATGFANVFVTQAEGFGTALAFANPSNENALLTFRLLNPAGTEVAVASMELASLAQRARFFDELFATGAVPAGFSGTLVIEAEVPVSITAIRTRNGIFISSYPVGQAVR
jgi:outer membrane protein assembly factor BamB